MLLALASSSTVAGDSPAIACGDGPVDQADTVAVEVAGEGGDLAGDPGFALECAHHGEGEREAVAQVQDVGELGADGGVVGLLGPCELGECELAHRRGAVSAGLDHLLPGVAGRVGILDREVGVQVGPARDQQQVVHLGPAAYAHRDLGGGESRCRVEVVETRPGGHAREGVNGCGGHGPILDRTRARINSALALFPQVRGLIAVYAGVPVITSIATRSD